MRSATVLLFLLAPAAARAEHTIAVVGLVHSHVWGHLKTMLAGTAARLAGVAGSIPEPAAEAQQRGVPPHLFHADYREMLDAVKPEIVGAFVENNRHLEIARECARRRIQIMVEKPLASSHREALAIRDLARNNGISSSPTSRWPGGRPTTPSSVWPATAPWARCRRDP